MLHGIIRRHVGLQHGARAVGCFYDIEFTGQVGRAHAANTSGKALHVPVEDPVKLM